MIVLISNYIFTYIFIVNNTAGGNCTSNEFKCQEPEMELENNSYVLKDKCISQDMVNDGRPDCEDRSDEFGTYNQNIIQPQITKAWVVLITI